MFEKTALIDINRPVATADVSDRHELMFRKAIRFHVICSKMQTHEIILGHST